MSRPLLSENAPSELSSSHLDGAAVAGRKPRAARFRTWTPKHTRERSEQLRREASEEADAAAAAGDGSDYVDEDGDVHSDASSMADYHSDSFDFGLVGIEEGAGAEESAVGGGGGAGVEMAAAAAAVVAADEDKAAYRKRVRARRRTAKSLGDGDRRKLSVYAPTASSDAEEEMDREVAQLPEEGDDTVYRVYPKRFLVLALFGAMSMANAIAWIAFAPIQSLTEEFYGINVTQVNLMTLVYSVSYIPMTPLVSWVYLRYSLRTGILLGGGLTAVGAWIRVASVNGLGSDAGASYGAFYWLLLGQIVAGVAQPFFNNATSRLSATWFSARSRGIATTIAAMQVFKAIFLNSCCYTLSEAIIRVFVCK